MKDTNTLEDVNYLTNKINGTSQIKEEDCGFSVKFDENIRLLREL